LQGYKEEYLKKRKQRAQKAQEEEKVELRNPGVDPISELIVANMQVLLKFIKNISRGNKRLRRDFYHMEKRIKNYRRKELKKTRKRYVKVQNPNYL
jgi:hypothetical protein